MPKIRLDEQMRKAESKTNMGKRGFTHYRDESSRNVMEMTDQMTNQMTNRMLHILLRYTVT